MFNDYGWLGNRMALQRTLEEMWLARIQRARAKVVVIEIGAGTAIPSVRNFGARTVEQTSARLIRINARDFAVHKDSAIGIGLGALDAQSRIEAAREAIQDSSTGA